MDRTVMDRAVMDRAVMDWTVMERNEFNEIVAGLIKRFELLRAYGVVEAPVAREKIMALSMSGKKGARVAFVAAARLGADGGVKKGEPFAGEEGELLGRIARSMGLQVEDVCMCIAARCRQSPGNLSMPEFESEIKRASPRVMVTLGEEAARMVLANEAPLGALRGRFHSYGTIKVMPTHHPAAIIKNPGLKRETWEDIKMVISELVHDS
jgi:DNA polymerase